MRYGIPLRNLDTTSRARGRIAKISNRFLYSNIPPLTPGQVKSLMDNPYMMDELITKFGPKVVQAMTNKSRDSEPPSDLIPQDKLTKDEQAPVEAIRKDSPERKYKQCVFLASLEMNKQSDDELDKATSQIVDILNQRIPSVGLVIEFPDQVEDLMRPYDPKSTIVFNWADTIGGFPHGGQHVADTLARLGFDDAGSSPLTQEIATSRSSTFKFLRELGVSVPEYRMVSSPEEVKYWKHGYPVLIRPNDQHGSEGLRVANDPKEAANVVDELIDEGYDPPLIMIEKIEGREFSVAAWTDGESWEVFPIAEANFEGSSDDVKDEKDKSSSSASAAEQNIIPAKISTGLKEKLGETTVDVLSRVGTNIWGRVDYRMKKGSRTPVVIDVNAEPDITEDTLFVECAKVAGMTYDDVILGILDKAIEKYTRKWQKAQQGVAEVKKMSTGESSVKKGKEGVTNTRYNQSNDRGGASSVGPGRSVGNPSQANTNTPIRGSGF